MAISEIIRISLPQISQRITVTRPNNRFKPAAIAAGFRLKKIKIPSQILSSSFS